MRAFIACVLALGIVACGSHGDRDHHREPVAPPPPVVAEPAPPPVDTPPVAPTPAEPAQPPATEQPSAASTLHLAPFACGLVGDAVRVWSHGGPATVRVVNGAAIVLGYDERDDGLYLYAARVHGSSSSPLFRTRLPHATHPSAPPALVATPSGRLFIAAIDGSNNVYAALADAMLPTPGIAPREVAQSADRRFAPAIYAEGAQLFLAYTKSATPMRVMAITMGADMNGATERDITPEGMGGTAATYLDGAMPSTLLFVDAHGGLSPILGWTRSGDSASVRVERALSTLAEPASIAGAAYGEHRFVAYVAIGRAATSAVGLVELGHTDAPVAIVPGTGYGQSHVTAAASRQGAVFAVDSPAAGESRGERVITVRVFANGALGEPLSVATQGANASFASIAADTSDPLRESFALSWTTSDAVYLARVACDFSP